LATEHDKLAAKWVVEQHVRSNFVVGLGDGPLAALVVAELGTHLRDGHINGISCWAGSAATAALCAFEGVPLVADERNAVLRLDVFIEEPDELDDSAAMPYVVGRLCVPTQPELLRAKQLRDAAASVVLIAPLAALSRAPLASSVPILIDAEEWEEVADAIDDVFIGDATLWRRSLSSSLTGPFGGPSPYISADGCTIVDIVFEDGYRIDGEPVGASEICDAIDGVVGVITHGLVVNAKISCAVLSQPGAATPRICFPYVP
jgi:ribose 5-phosphate isomerase A